jgi:hypothetical protein
VGRAIQSIIRLGWTAALWDSFDTNAIAWGACGVGLLFLMREKHDAIRSADLVVTVPSLILIMLPTEPGGNPAARNYLFRTGKAGQSL